MTPLIVVWTDFSISREYVLGNVEDALRMITDLRDANINPPPMVEFFEPLSGKAFTIAAAKDETILTYQESLDPPYYISLGDTSKTGITSFCYGNEDTEYLNSNLIPFLAGLEALKFFVQNRKMPPGISWEQL